MNMSMMASGASAVGGILSGMSKIAIADTVAKEQKKMLKQRAEFNKKEINEAFAQNYAKLMNQYANQQSNIIMQRSAAENEIKLNSSQMAVMSDVDMSGSSFLTSAKAELENEFNTSMNQLTDWKYQQSLDMSKAAINQKLSVDLGVAKNTFDIKNQEYQATREGIMEILSSAANFGMEAYNQYSDNKAKQEQAKQTQNTKFGVQTGSQYYGWGKKASMPSGESGSYFSLKYF